MFMPMIMDNERYLNPFTMFDDFDDNIFDLDFADCASMKTDVIEEDNDYKLVAELPGFNKEDISADIKNGMLTIKAQTSNENNEKDENGKYVRRERRNMSYQRSFRVGDNVHSEDISAKYENGVLTMTIPKKAEEKNNALQIEVK